MTENLLALLSRFPALTVMVIGDFMLDEYLIGDVSRISPEAPVPVVAVQQETFLPGGAGNVARNLIDLGANVVCCGIVGDDSCGREVLRQLTALGADVECLLTSCEVRTTCKTRILARSQHLVRVDRDNHSSIPDTLRADLLKMALARLPECSGLLLSDYNKGLLSVDLAASVIEQARRLRLIAVADPKPSNMEQFRGATLVTPNAAEAATASGIACDTPEGLRAAASRLLEWLDLEAVLVTRGEKGMYLAQTDGTEDRLEALATQVYDVTGAGDTVAALVTASLCAGASLLQAMTLANIAASRVVQHLGCATVGPEELTRMLDG